VLTRARPGDGSTRALRRPSASRARRSGGSARAGWGWFRLLHVVDRYAAGAGSTDGRLFDATILDARPI
jgi:hypothetical protein